MSKTDITLEQARAVIDRVAQELGLIIGETAGFLKIQGPGNKHRIYVQRSRTLSRIDTTVALPADDPAYRPLSNPNGSISCHVAPDLEQLERVLRMLGDSSLATQVPNKPRPFAATKAPAARRPKAVATPIPEAALKELPSEQDKELTDRLAILKAQSKKAKINNILENPEKYGQLSYDEAEAWLDAKRTLKELAEEHASTLQAAQAAEVADIAAETGLEFAQ